MINKIEIENFRSIVKASLALNELTVIVGANATGKSNLIKAIDFISDIVEFGIQEAIYKRGGVFNIVPKQIEKPKDAEISFTLNFNIEAPPNWEEKGLPPLEVEYHLKIKGTKKNSYRISKERIIVKSILLLAYFLEEDLNSLGDKELNLSSDELQHYQESEIEIWRNTQHNIDYNVNFDLDDANLKMFVNWLGLKSIYDDSKPTVGSIKRLAKHLLNMDGGKDKKSESVFFSDSKFVFNFARHLRLIMTELKSYGRYDLLINELRKEQSIGSGRRVSISGDNLPSIIKKFIRTDKEGWGRVLATMSNISPYFQSVFSESLRPGKEYLTFKEIFSNRKIEAWEASDGTLRALAILISMEVHPSGSTLLIEEPEHGLHPWAVKELIDHIREVVAIKGLQIILTTHSPQVLENIEKDELLIAERDEEGTTYCHIEEVIPGADISMGEIGELWTRGLLKGVPRSL